MSLLRERDAAGEREANPTRHRPARRRPSTFAVVGFSIGVVMALVVGVPLLKVVVSMFWQDGSLTTEAVRRTLAVDDLGTLVVHTVVVVLASSVLACAIGVFLAWANVRTDARLGLLNDALPYLPFLLPPVAGAVGWTMLLSPKAGLLNSWLRDGLDVIGISLDSGPFDINSWYGLIMVYTFYAVPYVYMNVAAAMTSVDSSLEEASRISGAGTWKTLRRVTLPGLAPSIGAGFLLSVWFGFGMFSIAAIIATPADIDILAVRIVRLLTFTYPPDEDVAIGLSAIVMVFVGLSYYLQLRILRSSRFGSLGGKGVRRHITELGRLRPVVRGVVLVYVLVSVVLPMAALFIVALNGFWTPHIDWSGLGFDAFRTAIADDPKTQQAFVNSLGLGVVGATLGIAAASLISLAVAQHRNRASETLDASIKLPAAISHMVIAVGILLLLGGEPFNLGGTWLILLIGYLALYLPQASIAADAAVTVVGRELGEASRISGAGEWRTFARVYGPLMLPGLIGGWALLFIRILGDLTASAILSGTSNVVLGFRILEVFNGGSYALLAALSSVLVLLSSLVLVAVLWFSRRFGLEKTHRT